MSVYRAGDRRRHRIRQAVKTAAGVAGVLLLAGMLAYVLAGTGAANGGPAVPAAPACWPCR